MNKEFYEEIKGETPNGGVSSIAYFKDKDGNPCTKDKAVAMNIVEYDKDGNRVYETYLVKE